MSTTFDNSPSADASSWADVSTTTDALIDPRTQDVIPSYLYQQFADDADLQAFVGVYNAMAQGYLNWFNATSLALYTSAAISGLLLDWILQGIYGITRPSFITGTNVLEGPVGTVIVGTLAVGEFYSSSASSITASDDIYKRFATWILYQGDGVQMSVQWLKRRVNRFLYGAYGADTSLDTLQTVSVAISGSAVTLTVPSVSGATALAALVSNHLLPLPFQMTFSVTVES